MAAWRPAQSALALLVWLSPGFASAWQVALREQASLSLLAGRDTSLQSSANIRVLPSLDLSVPVAGDWTFGAELAGNAYATVRYRWDDDIPTDVRAKPYRLWVRASTPRLDARVGLQRINFGSATLLRPLMWFDRIDPRNPLQMTDGVYGLLGRYYFPGNANLWLWGLLGNSVTKGWEVLPTEKWKPELGGRVQMPVPRGELAVSGHYRQADTSYLDTPFRFPEETPWTREIRLGLDGKWDIGPGVWFEGVVARAQSNTVMGWLLLQRMLTLGSDYTFRVGNGLSLLAEHMVVSARGDAFSSLSTMHLSALMLSYPLGIVDDLKGIALYDWTNHGLYRFLSWQRTLDNWIFQVAAFWNPSRAGGLAGQPVSGAAAGYGVQLMIAFNH